MSHPSTHPTPPGFGFMHLLAGLRDGRASWGARSALSIAAAACVLGGMFFVLGVLEARGVRIQDEHAAIFVPLAIVSWLVLIYLIWATFGRWRSLLRTVFTCLIVLAVAIGLSVLIGSTVRNSEMLIGGIITLAVAVNLCIAISVVNQLARGRAVLAEDGSVAVNCPGCGYSMAGLDSSACPECGKRYTLDELIRGQNYEAVRAQLAKSPMDRLQAALSPAPQSAPAQLPNDSNEEPARGLPALPESA